MLVEVIGGTACAAAGLVAYGVRGRTAQIFGPSVHHGTRKRRSVALTFDDGPTESTPKLLNLLAEQDVRATFFQCGINVRRHPEISVAVRDAGHEIGSHSDSHTMFCFRSPRFIHEQLARAQRTIAETTGFTPTLFRAPCGARWFGLRKVQRELGLLGVMWTEIGRDWKLPAPEIAARLLRGVRNGSILCLHDGRDVQPNPDIQETLDALRILIPELKAKGFRFETVSEILRP